MKNYQKPQLETFNLALDKAIASSGLGTWLEFQGYDSDVTNHITTFEVNS